MRVLVSITLFVLATDVWSQQLSPPITSGFKCLTNGCCDQHEWCRFWASIGECGVNEDWMTANCQLACGTCRMGPASPLPTTTTFVTSQPSPTTSFSSSSAGSSSSSSSSSVGSTSPMGSSSFSTFPSTVSGPQVTTQGKMRFLERPSRIRQRMREELLRRQQQLMMEQRRRQQHEDVRRQQDEQRRRQQEQQRADAQRQQMEQQRRQQQQQEALQMQQRRQQEEQQRENLLRQQQQQRRPAMQQRFGVSSSSNRNLFVLTTIAPEQNAPRLQTTTAQLQAQQQMQQQQFASAPQISPPSSGSFQRAPTGPVTAVTSCKDVPLNRAAETLLASGLVDAVDDTFGRATLSIDDITRAVPTGCVPQLKEEGVLSNCQTNLCYHLMYRSFDGTCNNLKRPMQGASFRPFRRHVSAQYDDGKGEPVSSITETRPTAREANRVMLSSAQSVVHDKFNNLMMQFGQFISHDISKTTLQPSAQCQTCSPVPSKCMPIPIASKDPNMQFKAKECLKVSRSAPICQVTPREQLNENTAYIDASMIYGSSSKDLFKFREGRTGFLRLTSFNNQMVLPFDQSKCTKEDSCVASFTAGDIRANLFIGLSSMHILFAREHNRIAKQLQALNVAWSGDRLFQEARKIVGATIQHIFFSNYLPKLLGSSQEKTMGPYVGYDENADSTIANEFTTGAFRFGHGMIEEFYQRVDFSGNNITHGGFFFGDGVFKSGKILWEGGIDPILRGFMVTAVKRPHRMTPAITEKMFGSTDLGSLNIQRGRDHGIPSYNRMRVFCGLPAAKTFEEFGDMILDRNLRFGLSKNYKTPDDVDFYVGAMLEDPVVGGLVGTTLSCVIGEQFKRTRNGDRFYYENTGVFTPRQLAELKKTSLAKIICNNGDHFELISQDAFLQPGPQMTPCNLLPDIDFSAWKE